MGKLTSGCTRAQSFLPKLQLSVWLSLAPCQYDADWRPLVCFGPTNRRAKNIRSRSFRSAMPETYPLAFVESLAKLATASPSFMFFPRLSFHDILFPITSETAIGSLSRGWRCSAVSRATLFCRSLPTQTGQSPRSPMSIRPTCCGRQEQQVKPAMDVVERKEAKRRARMTPGKIDHELHVVKKPEGSNKLKRVIALHWPAGELEWRSTS